MSPVIPTQQRLKEMALALKSLVNRLVIASWLPQKHISRNSQTNLSTKQTKCFDKIEELACNQADKILCRFLNFRESICAAKRNSDFFESIHLTIQELLSKKLADIEILNSNFPSLNRISNSKDELLSNQQHIFEQLSNKITPLILEENLKKNNYFLTLEGYCEKLKNNIINHTVIIIVSSDNYITSLKKEKLIKKIYYNNLIKKIIQAHIDSSYFRDTFHFNDQTKFNRLLIEKVRQYRHNINTIPSLNKRLKIWYGELDRLNRTEENTISDNEFPQIPQYRILLYLEIEELEDRLSEVGRIAFNFDGSYGCFKPIYDLLINEKCIDIPYKEFMAVLEYKKMKINWLGSISKLVQFMAVIERETTIFQTENFEAFICQYFTLHGKKIKGELNSTIKSKKSFLATGENGSEFYNVLTPIIHSSLSDYLYSSSVKIVG